METKLEDLKTLPLDYLRKERERLKELRDESARSFNLVSDAIRYASAGHWWGDRVEYEGNSYIICGVNGMWLMGNRIKKDGTPAIVETHLYNLRISEL